MTEHDEPSNVPVGPVLNWNMEALLAARGLNPFQVHERTKIHSHTIGQMARNLTSRVSLATLATLARDLGVGIGPAPDGAPDHQTLFTWEDDRLVWRLHTLMGDLSVRELFFATTVERSAIARMLDGSASQVSVEYMENLARYFGVGVAGPPPGVTSDAYLLVWGDTRVIYAAEEIDETPIPDEPLRVCKGPICRAIDPDGVEKRLDAFPLSKAYAYGRGPICKVCRRHQERERRASKKAKDAATPEANDDLAPSA